MSTQTWDVEAYGMVPVSKDVFYAAIGVGNVNPRIIGRQRYHPEFGYLTHWETTGGVVVGISFGIAGTASRQYGLTPSRAGKGGSK